MTSPRLFPVAAMWRQICMSLDISLARVLARMGLSADVLENKSKGVEATACFAFWDAVAAECALPDLPLRIGQCGARGPFQPALLAFSCSPDIRTGLSRLALFKPLCAPIRLELIERDERFDVVFHPEGQHRMPHIMAATEIVFFLELARAFTAHPVVPRGVELPDLAQVTPAYRAFVGGPIRQGSHARLSLTSEDARRPLISADTELYRLVERELTSRLEATLGDTDIVQRVRRTLIELLPSGQVSVDGVAARLGLSRRSLQRKLQENSTTFQSVLDMTRSSLAMTYLREKNLSAEETSYLLAYQDPNSFYRAFHDWTGMTPAQARGMRTN